MLETSAPIRPPVARQGRPAGQEPGSRRRAIVREIVIGGAQMGPIQKADSRADVVARMIALLDQARAAGCDLVVYPELALTTFFPRWMMEDQAEVDLWFETEMPNRATEPLFARARDHGIAISFGYAELTPDGRHFNTSILTDRSGTIIGKYRKVHLPGHSDYDPARTHQHLEKRYFEPGDIGFPVWRNMNAWMGMCICNDRRWPEVYREMGLQGVELVMLGYNTPSVNSQMTDEGLAKRLYHSELSMTAGAYQNATWVVGVAKAGVEDGHPLMAGSIIVDPNGFVVARAETEGDELIVHNADMDACAFGKETIFDFKRHRRIEHYGRITGQTGVILPDGG
jgi:predicted amidohydrolase